MHILNIVLLALIGFAFSLPINLRPVPKVDCRIARCAEGVPDCCTLPHDPGSDPELTIITGPFDGNPVPLPGFGGDPGADPELTIITSPFDGNPVPHPGFGGDPGADPELTIITSPFDGNPVPHPGFGGDPVVPFDKRVNTLEDRIFDEDMPREDTHGCSDGCHDGPGGGSGGGFPDLPVFTEVPEIPEDQSVPPPTPVTGDGP